MSSCPPNNYPKPYHNPPNHNPLLQAHRPPQQTSVQQSVLGFNLQNVQNQSDFAKTYVMQMIDTQMRPDLKDMPWLFTKTTEELYDMLAWEFSHQQIIHNGPIMADAANVDDDTDLMTTLSNGFIQNVWQRYLLGQQTVTEAVGEGYIMEQYMHYPAFNNAQHPTMREANDRVIYLATNWEKKCAGNDQFGEMTYVINSIYADKFMVSPWDTGAYVNRHWPLAAVSCHTATCWCPCALISWPVYMLRVAYCDTSHCALFRSLRYSKSNTGPTPFGTLTDFNHLIGPHLQNYKYSLASVFHRWYDYPKPAPLPLTYFYFEVDWSGNAWMPEGLLYMVPKFGALFGKDNGVSLQNWCVANRRPLVWADGDDSGMVIDPVVGQLIASGNDSFITNDMVTQFQAAWDGPHPPRTFGFPDLLAGVDPALRFNLPNYTRKELCDPYEGSEVHMIMGTNDAGGCIYWDYTDLPNQWECLNDGTCGQSINGKYNTEALCKSACGGSWTCMKNQVKVGPPGTYADKFATNCGELSATALS